jgi:hypothetical protein
VLSTLFAAVLALPARAGATEPPARAGALVWIITDRSLQRIAALPGAQGVLDAFFSSPSHSLLVGGRTGFTTELRASRALAFGSYRGMRIGLGRSRRGGALALPVILDLERWPLTPLAEQRRPAHYYRLAWRLAQRRGLILIATPSPNLVRVDRPGHGRGFRAYLDSGLVGHIARHADIFEVQAQGFERSTRLYRAFVAAAADEARNANPHILVIAGLSTNPGGRGVPARQLYRDVSAARPYVDGFWLNVPQRSTACRHCGVARPDIALRLLRLLRAHPGFLPGSLTRGGAGSPGDADRSG